MNLLDIIREHRHAKHEGDEVNEQREDSSLISSNASAELPLRSQAERYQYWLTRFIRGRYPKLADVRAAALIAGFSPDTIEAGLNSNEFVKYKAFRRRYVGEVEHVRTVDDWPDDSPLNGR